MSEKTLETIKKLVNLSKGTNYAGEAEKALAAAIRLCAKIGINIEDIKQESEAERELIGKHYVWKEKASFSKWERYLAKGISDAFGAVLLISVSNKQQFEIIGTKTDADLFDAVFPVIVKQLSLLWREYKRENSARFYGEEYWFKQSWYIGAVTRISERAKEIFKNESTDAEKEKYSLMIIDKNKRVKDFLNGIVTLKSKTRNFYTCGSAREAGYSAGGRVSFGNNRIAS